MLAHMADNQAMPDSATTRTTQRARVALIGCGAVAETFHLPALAAAGIVPSLLVDPSRERLQKISNGADYATAESHGDRLDDFDAAIVSVPHALHAPLAIDLLEHGKHVLVEKPMALTAAECNAMITAADLAGVTLSVGLIRRFRNLNRWTKAVLDDGALGRVTNFEVVEGFAYDWRVTSDSFWRREKSGGGVLVDSGAHALDLLTWWLGDFAEVAYRDDSRGGVEADCVIELTMASGARGTVELSRTRDLGGGVVIRGERGAIALDFFSNDMQADPAALLDIRHAGRKPKSMPVDSNRKQFEYQTRHWLDVVAGRAEPLCDGRSASISVGLIDRCYACRENWSFPWDVEDGR